MYDVIVTINLSFLSLSQMRSLVNSFSFLLERKILSVLNWLMPKTFIPLHTMVRYIFFNTLCVRQAVKYASLLSAIRSFGLIWSNEQPNIRLRCIMGNVYSRVSNAAVTNFNYPCHQYWTDVIIHVINIGAMFVNATQVAPTSIYCNT